MGRAGQLVVSVGGPRAIFLGMCTRHGAKGCLQDGITLGKAQPAAVAPSCGDTQSPRDHHSAQWFQFFSVFSHFLP